MKRDNGKLLSTKWLDCEPGQQVCYTCKYHDWDTLNTADRVRLHVYEHVTHKVYFCAQHARIAETDAASTLDAAAFIERSGWHDAENTETLWEVK